MSPLGERVRLGVIGFGKLGSIHAANVATTRGAELVAVCDPNPVALARAVHRHGVVAVPDLDDFLALPLDGVVIASNTPLHAEHIRAAALAGKAIFSEKPVGLSLPGTDDVLQQVVDAGVPFQIGFQRRWDERYQQAKAVIDSGEIGDPVLFKCHGRDPDASDPANWGLDRNGGLFLNCAIHDYDAARFLMGREVERLCATGAALVHKGLGDLGDADTCATSLFFGGDAMALTEWSRYACYGYDIAMEVVGTRGIVQFGQQRDWMVIIRRSASDVGSVFDVFGDAYRRSMEGFVDAIVTGLPTRPGVQDARIALHLALTARQSFELGGNTLDVAALAPLQATAGSETNANRWTRQLLA
jgi:predicted dehydrogenase